jgi:septal ring factor EnvC (AmiA/AmiB activator)
LHFKARRASRNFASMKRVFAALVLTAALVSGARAADAVSLAAQQEMTENYRRLAATVEELQAAQLAQQKQISTLASELSKLREEVNRKDQNAAM